MEPPGRLPEKLVQPRQNFPLQMDGQLAILAGEHLHLSMLPPESTYSSPGCARLLL